MDARIVYNPTAGPRDVHGRLDRLCAFFSDHGWSVELLTTEKPGDAVSMARRAASDGLDAVLIAGGDGTVNEAVNGLVGSETALGVLPVGTGNLWAKQLCVPTYTLPNPLRLREAARGLLRASVRRIDVGEVNGHAFLCWASAGFDAQVTTEMEPRDRVTKRLGALPYLVAAFLVAQDFRGVETSVRLDDDEVHGRALLVVVHNIQQYGGLVEVAPRAKLDDGFLDVLVFEGLGFGYVLRHLLRVLSQRYLDDPNIVHRQAQRIEIQCEEPLPVQVDGDPLGTTPVAVRVIPRALRILAPPTMPPDLLTESTDQA